MGTVTIVTVCPPVGRGRKIIPVKIIVIFAWPVFNVATGATFVINV